MDRLREYLNQLFAGAGESPEVLYAKAELLQMMEDKFEGLLEEGKTEDEAVDIIISEFGNFEEIAKELGIEDVIDGKLNTPNNNAGNTQNNQNNTANPAGVKVVQMAKEQIINYIKFAKKHACMVATGISCFILAPYFASISDDVLELFVGHKLAGVASSLAFFLFVALGVVQVILAANLTKKSGKLHKCAVNVTEDGIEELNAQSNSVNSSQVIMLVIGIALCICAPAASALGDVLPGMLRIVFSPGTLLFAAMGVYFIVYSSSLKNRLIELEKGIKNSSYSGYNAGFTTTNTAGDPTGGEQINSIPSPAENNWNYQPKSNIPVWAIIVIVIVCAIGVSSVFTFVPGINSAINSGSAGGQYDGTEKVSASSVTSFDINLAASDVNINKGTGNEVIVEYHGTFNSKPTLKQDGSKLELKVNDKSFNLFGNWNNDGQITITVPANKEIAYDFEMAAGNLNVNDIKMSDMKAELAAGNYNLNGGSISGNAKFEMAAGNLTISNTPVGNLDAELAAGEFKYHFKDKKEADEFNFELDCALGNTTFFGDSSSGIASKKAVSGTGNRTFKVEAAAGSVTID
ncbi:MAG: DUF4097 domain-containing protein [Eubacterium sp.]|nr:DUF4097 domain-containing protein [Eubacterium sp.]